MHRFEFVVSFFYVTNKLSIRFLIPAFRLAGFFRVNFNIGLNFYVYAQGFSVATWNFMYIFDLRINWLKKFLDWRLCCVSPTKMQKGIITWFDTSFKKNAIFIVGEMKRGDKYYKNEMSHGHILLSLVGIKWSEYFNVLGYTFSYLLRSAK